MLNHPTQLVARLGASDGTTRYTYDRTIGALQAVTDPLGQQVSFAPNARGELSQVTRPGPVTEGRTYWPDGAIATQIVANGPSTYWRTASFDYDWQGGLFKRADGVRGEFFGAKYSALGHLLSFADTTTLPGQSGVTTSSDSVDVYGNAYKSTGLQSQTSFYANSNNYDLSRSGSGGATRKYQARTGRLWFQSTQLGTDTLHYDASGNVEFLGQAGDMKNWTTTQHESRHSYYDAANKLRFADYRTGSENNTLNTYRTAFDEYRYDALGRRVLVWSRLACADQRVPIGQAVFSGTTQPVTADVTAICRASFARRIVWDGSQELWEIQAPSDSTGGPLVENDVNPITSLPTTGTSSSADPYTQYGLTAYAFGLELDRPVSVIRANWVGAYRPDGVKGTPVSTPAMAFYPHYLDAGQPYVAGFADGQISRCVTTTDGQRCLTPTVNFRADFLPWAQGSYVESVWLGSLLSDKQDKTLTFYRRNRVYDPLTRQFTQEDPIGLAGGLNAYGFAGGDPVNFSDPFGLCPKDAGGDGATDSYADCLKGSSGYYANQAATGHGGVINNILGAGASCGESGICESLAVTAGAIAGLGFVRPLFAAEKLDRTVSDRTSGLRWQLDAHKRKLADYIRDPHAADNKGFLKDASPELRDRIIQARIRKLEDQIRNFEEQIKKIMGGGQ